MIQKTHLTSRFFIRLPIFYWTVGILLVIDILLSEYIPKETRPLIEIALIFIYVIILFFASFCLFFNSFSHWDIEHKIRELEEEKKRKLEYNQDFNNEISLLLYKKVQKEIIDKKKFVHFLKTREELTKSSNGGNYIFLLLIFFVSQFSFDYLIPFGPILFIIIVTIFIIFCLQIIVWEVIKRRNGISAIAIGHAVVIYFLLGFDRGSYSRNFGDEIIGSYFEKPEYTTQYYVNIFSKEDGSKNYRLPADIHVFSETEEDQYDNLTLFTTRYIMLKRAYWPNGGYVDFDDCELKIGSKELCIDGKDRTWYIELTTQKVK